MTHKLTGACLALVIVALGARPASAANKEHQQLMADIRMLQEQAQLLQNLLGTLNESLKAVNARLDQQAETARKAFADQKLIIDNLSNDARVIREKLDDNNVRVGSLSQEVQALRQALQQAASRPAVTTEPDSSGGASPAGTASSPGPPPAPMVAESPQKLFDAAQADYFAGQYDLAISGFQGFIRTFPKHDLSDDAQVYICRAYLNDHKDQQAADACDTAIRTYPGGNAIPSAYYTKGLALSNLRNLAGAREAWETLIKNFPDANEVPLARQQIDRIKRP
jgi:TolA-binding protein